MLIKTKDEIQNQKERDEQKQKEYAAMSLSKKVSKRNSLESNLSINSNDKVENKIEEESEKSSDDSECEDEVVQKIDGIESNFKKAVKNLTQQIDTIELEITKLNNKVDTIDFKITNNIHTKITTMQSDISQNFVETKNFTEFICKTNYTKLEKIIDS